MPLVVSARTDHSKGSRGVHGKGLLGAWDLVCAEAGIPFSQRIHVNMWSMLGPYLGCCVLTFGPMYLRQGYKDCRCGFSVVKGGDGCCRVGSGNHHFVGRAS